MTTQLRLVEAPKARPKPRRATPRRARSVAAGRARVRWGSDWHLDPSMRQIGREGVATARAALARVAGDAEYQKAS